MLESSATIVPQRLMQSRGRDRSRSRGKDGNRGRDETRGRGVKQRRAEQRKTGRLPCKEREMREPELAGEERVETIATRAPRVRIDLTPLFRAAHARNCARSAREQSLLRGSAIECGGLTMCRVIKGAYRNKSVKSDFLNQANHIRIL